MSRLLLLRHGESAANAHSGGETLSEEDGDRLTERGRKQASAAGPELRGLGVAKLLTSPMRRARETSAIVGEALELEPEVVDYAHELRAGESFEQILARVRRLKGELEGEGGPKPPLLVTHGIFIRFFLLDSLLGEDFEPRHAGQIWQLASHNCALSVFARDEYRDPAGTPVPDWVCFSWMERPWDRP
jgi:broad specificity phosphatase PhoE